MPCCDSERWGWLCYDFGNNIMVQYSVGPIVFLQGRITAKEYVERLGTQVRRINQTFPNNDAVLQDDNAHINTTGTVQSSLEDHEGERHHLPWPAQSSDMSIIEPLLSVSVRNRFSAPISVLREEWYKILLETVKNLYVSIPRSITSLLNVKYGPTPCK
jgi:hypothetical protein